MDAVGRRGAGTGRRALLAGAALAAGGWAAVRRPWLRSGATGREVHATLPGDDLIPQVHLQATRARTLHAPPDAVWPWLVQMGNGRGGWYSYDGVDNGGRPSLTHLDPTLQDLAVGQAISDATGPFSFDVVTVDPPRALVLRACIHPITGRPVPRAATDPDARGYAAAFMDFTWAFVLQPTPEGSRLLVRVRYRHSRGAWVRAMVHGFELVDAVFARRMLQGLADRVEGRIATETPTSTPAPRQLTQVG